MIDNAQLKQIAHLSKLSVDDSAFESSAQDLNNILALAQQLSQINTDEITPMAHPLHMTQRLREDEVKEQNHSNRFQSIAPKTGNQHYLVPTVIE